MAVEVGFRHNRRAGSEEVVVALVGSRKFNSGVGFARGYAVPHILGDVDFGGAGVVEVASCYAPRLYCLTRGVVGNLSGAHRAYHVAIGVLEVNERSVLVCGVHSLYENWFCKGYNLSLGGIVAHRHILASLNAGEGADAFELKGCQLVEVVFLDFAYKIRVCGVDRVNPQGFGIGNSFFRVVVNLIRCFDRRISRRSAFFRLVAIEIHAQTSVAGVETHSYVSSVYEIDVVVLVGTETVKEFYYRRIWVCDNGFESNTQLG